MPKGIYKNGKKNNWWKGKKRPPRTKEHKEKHRLKMLGKKHSEETIKKISKSNIGHPATIGMTGRKHSIETRLKMSEAQRGEKSSHWKGGTRPIYKIIRQSVEYRLWREAVFKRDNYTCIWCGLKFIKGETGRVILHADHIKPFAYYPELRFALDNGRTLCIDCHKTTDTYLNNNYKK